MVDGVHVRSRMDYRFFGHPENMGMLERQNRFLRKFDKVSSALLTVPKVLRQVKPAFIQRFFEATQRPGLDKFLWFRGYYRLILLYPRSICFIRSRGSARSIL